MKRKSFTFIQAAVAALILGIGLLPVISVFQQSNRFVYKSQALLDATIIAQSIIDEVKTEPSLEKLVNRDIKLPDSTFKNLIIPERFIKNFKGWGELKISIAANHTIPGRGIKEDQLKEISVIVHWEEMKKERKTKIVTYHANINSMKLNAFSRFK
ncbi:hypothetical protein ACFL35_13220 [Candidatus Riflebacteria bacterium]